MKKKNQEQVYNGWPYIVKEYLTLGTTLKFDFNVNNPFCPNDIITWDKMYGQQFDVEKVEGPTVYMKLIGLDNVIDHTHLVPGTEFKVISTCVGEYDTVICRPTVLPMYQIVDQESKSKVEIETIKQGNKTIFKVKK